MRTTFIKMLINQAKTDEKIFLLTPDMGFSVFEEFICLFPDRFLNVGISEQNAISVASGLALSGFKPYVYSISPFVTMRCFEQIRVDIAYMEANVKIVGVGGGVAYGPAGATHHAIEDIAIIRSLPNMTICAPCDQVEMASIMNLSFEYIKPMYIRLSKNNEPVIHKKNIDIHLGKAVRITDGHDFFCISYGPYIGIVKQWVEEWQQNNIFASLYSFHTIKPLDLTTLDIIIKSGKPVLVSEEHNIFGGLGEAIASYFATHNAKNKISIMGIPDTFSHYVGSQNYILKKFNLIDKPDLSLIGFLL